MIKTKVSIAPTSEPITLSQAKEYLFVDDTAQDARITSLISRARNRVEQLTSKVFASTTLVTTGDVILDIWNKNRIAFLKFPYSPVNSITSVKNETALNIWSSALSTSFYSFDENTLSLLSGALDGSISNRVQVTYVAGYIIISPNALQSIYATLQCMNDHSDDCNCYEDFIMNNAIDRKVLL